MTSGSFDPLPREGARIRLRRLRGEDLSMFQTYRADPAVGRFQGWSPMPVQAAAAFLVGMSTATFGVPGEWFQLGIAEQNSDRLVGDMGFCICGPDNQHAELGFSLAREFQGHGLATEAVGLAVDLLFESTNVARVVSITDECNLACLRLLARVGMVCVSRINSVRQGEPCVQEVHVRSRKT